MVHLFSFAARLITTLPEKGFYLCAFQLRVLLSSSLNGHFQRPPHTTPQQEKMYEGSDVQLLEITHATESTRGLETLA